MGLMQKLDLTIGAIGLIILVHASCSTIQYRSTLKIREEEFIRPPVQVIVEVIAGSLLCLWAALTVPGSFLEILPDSNANRIVQLPDNLDFMIFNHRGKNILVTLEYSCIRASEREFAKLIAFQTRTRSVQAVLFPSSSLAQLLFVENVSRKFFLLNKQKYVSMLICFRKRQSMQHGGNDCLLYINQHRRSVQQQRFILNRNVLFEEFKSCMDRGMQGSVQGKLRENAPHLMQVLALVTFLVVAIVGGLTLAGTVIVCTPIFLLFSPILVPVGIALFLGACGLFLAGSSVLGFISFATWVYKYFSGRHPVGADKFDAARHRIMDSVNHIGERGSEYASMTASKVQEAAPGA